MERYLQKIARGNFTPGPTFRLWVPEHNRKETAKDHKLTLIHLYKVYASILDQKDSLSDIEDYKVSIFVYLCYSTAYLFQNGLTVCFDTGPRTRQPLLISTRPRVFQEEDFPENPLESYWW